MSCAMNDTMPMIIRGTTPTIKFCFCDIDVSEIEVAYIIIKQHNRSKIEKDITSAFKIDNYILWRLTQEETLLLAPHTSATIDCDWKLTSGLRGKSHRLTVAVENSGKDEVI